MRMTDEILEHLILAVKDMRANQVKIDSIRAVVCEVWDIPYKFADLYIYYADKSE